MTALRMFVSGFLLVTTRKAECRNMTPESTSVREPYKTTLVLRSYKYIKHGKGLGLVAGGPRDHGCEDEHPDCSAVQRVHGKLLSADAIARHDVYYLMVCKFGYLDRFVARSFCGGGAERERQGAKARSVWRVTFGYIVLLAQKTNRGRRNVQLPSPLPKKKHVAVCTKQGDQARTAWAGCIDVELVLYCRRAEA
ncbi:hypothetical protein IF2G_10367 [Cordyceps javanica]|nr:hypothetical protein IF2G_10367 [Cordyceps javanica]